MYVRHLALRDFRSWQHVELELAPGRTVFVGQNGFGKTNLVEALWYCATLGSHRVATDAPLIRAKPSVRWCRQLSSMRGVSLRLISR